jgi:hypothetical protein
MPSFFLVGLILTAFVVPHTTETPSLRSAERVQSIETA